MWNSSPARLTTGNSIRLRPRVVFYAGLLTCVFATLNAHAESPEKRYDFHIEEQALGAAITALVQRTDKNVLFPYELAGETGLNPVIGRYTIEEALEVLLRNTRFSGGLSENGVLFITLSETEEQKDRGDQVTRGSSKKGLLAGVAALLFGGANAQETEQIITDIEADPHDEVLDEIVVTGTNIRGVENLASPLTVITREDIDRQGFATTQQLLRNVPQFLDAGENGSVTASSVNGSAATGTVGVNVRGLGVGATLTLVNGRRVAAGGGLRQVVDVSLIPLSAVERVEVLTDGASAIYGTDAIAGVVNFILREDFDGAQTSFRFGGVTEGSSQEYQVGQTLGRTWGSGNVLASYEYYRRNALDTRAREFTEEAPDPSDIVPQTERHSVFVTGNRDLSDTISVFGNGFFAVRDTDINVTSASAVGLLPSINLNQAEQYGATLGAAASLGANWRAEFAGSYSSSRSDNFSDSEVNENIRFESDLELSVVDIQADGPLFSLSGGDAKLAIGAQYRSERFESNTLSDAVQQAFRGERDVYALFGELYAPIIGESNRRPGVHALDLIVAGRFEDYSDFGSSVDPKVSLRYAPTNSLNFRGTYGTSFRAPNFITLGGSFGGIALPGIFLLPPPGQAAAPNILLVDGANPDLGPEQSRAWTLGFDYAPTRLDGLTVKATYFDIRFEDRIARPGATGLRTLFPNRDSFGPLLVLPADPNFALLMDEFFPTEVRFNPFGLAPEDIGAVFDDRVQNIASTDVSGLDFAADYLLETDAGDFQLGLSGSYLFRFSQRNLPAGDPVDTLNLENNPVDLRLRGNLGWIFDSAAVSVFINYVDSYRSDATGVIQAVDSWTTADLNLTYRFSRERYGSAFGDARASLSIINVLNEDPPFVDRTNNFSNSGQNFDGANANALGRVVTLQLEKSF